MTVPRSPAWGLGDNMNEQDIVQGFFFGFHFGLGIDHFAMEMVYVDPIKQALKKRGECFRCFIGKRCEHVQSTGEAHPK